MLLPARNQKAFTLLELIVVIVVLGILAAIAVPTFAKVIEKSRTEAVTTTTRALDRDARALAAFEKNAPAGQEWRTYTQSWVGAAAEELPDQYRVNQSVTAGKGNHFRVSDGATTVYLVTSDTGPGAVSTTEPASTFWSTDDLQEPGVRAASGENLLVNSGYEAPLPSVGVFGYFNTTITRTTTSYTGSGAADVTASTTTQGQGIIHMPPHGVTVPSGTLVQGEIWVKGVPGLAVAVSGRPAGPTGAYFSEGRGEVVVTLTGEWQKLQTQPWAYPDADFLPGLQVRTVTTGHSGHLFVADDASSVVLP